MKELIEELEEIANQAGDNLDRERGYTSDKIWCVVVKLRAGAYKK
jgi:hypothetical protein